MNNDICEFSEANEADLEFINKIIGRGGVHDLVKNAVKSNNKIDVGFQTDKEKKFTTALVKMRAVNSQYLFSGASKRMTYEKRRDPHVIETGNNVALARAIRSMPFVL